MGADHSIQITPDRVHRLDDAITESALCEYLSEGHCTARVYNGAKFLKIMTEHNHEWDAGELGCGELVLGVRKRLRAHPGQVLRLIALDTGAAVDLQAFCNMTGDVLVAVDPISKTYWLRGREK